MNPPDTFQTERLLLRRPREDDAERLFRKWGQDPEVTRYLTWEPHETVEDARAHLARCAASWSDGTAYVWFLEDREAGALVGSLACRRNQRGVNLGYLLARDSWGRGYMAEALGPVVEWWLQRPDVFRVWAVCDVENSGSARVLEKAGFQLEGTLRRWEVHPNLSDEPRDSLCYSRIKEDNGKDGTK